MCIKTVFTTKKKSLEYRYSVFCIVFNMHTGKRYSLQKTSQLMFKCLRIKTQYNFAMWSQKLFTTSWTYSLQWPNHYCQHFIFILNRSISNRYVYLHINYNLLNNTKRRFLCDCANHNINKIHKFERSSNWLNLWSTTIDLRTIHDGI